MNMVDVNGQLANIAQIARKCPTATLRRAYVRALREWCQQTQWLRTNVVGATAPNEAQYSLGSDPDLDIVAIFAMQGTVVPAGGNIQKWPLAASNSGGWNPNLQPERPTQYAYIPEGQFALYPVPNAVYTLGITLILQPKEQAVNVPAAPLVKYSNEIEAGALAYLLMVPGMPWSQPNLAAGYDKKFSAGISNGKAEAQRQFNTGSQRAQPRQFIV